MVPTRNNRGVSHENGAVESPHGHLKRRLAQALLLRESADFASLADYRSWLDALVVRFNRRCGEALVIEREHLQALPAQRTTDYSEQVVRVTTSSTIEVQRVLYTVPARLIGERLRLHLYDDRIEGFLGAAPAVTLPRLHARAPARARCIDYRHVIAALVRKPQAFRAAQWRRAAAHSHLPRHLAAPRYPPGGAGGLQTHCRHSGGGGAGRLRAGPGGVSAGALRSRRDPRAAYAATAFRTGAQAPGRPLSGAETQHPMHAYAAVAVPEPRRGGPLTWPMPRPYRCCCAS